MYDKWGGGGGGGRGEFIGDECGRGEGEDF